MTNAAPASKLHHLISLAGEQSSPRRRELLREVTDLFFTVEDGHGQTEMSLFDDVLSKLAGEMEEAVRVELAQRIAQAPVAPRRLLNGLASDSIAVAQPVLENSAIPEDVQLHIARTKGEEHLQALSRRQHVSALVTDAIVERGNDETLGVLLKNEGAELSRASQETIVDRAQANPDLHEAVIDRQSLPIDLLNEMYFVVEAKLRDRILAKNDDIDPAELERALIAGRKQVQTRDGALPADYAVAEADIAAMHERGQINPQALAAMLRNRETTRFLVALSLLADVDFHTARRILERRELDALAIVCRAADFDRALFLTFAILILDKEADAMNRARQYGELYSNLPKDAAMRTIRFWKLRRQTGDVAAA